MPQDPKTILLVDDSATMRRMVKATLRGLGSPRFVEAANGLEAIEQMSLAKVDLVVLDLNMPDMHGLEVVTFLRKHAVFREVPIIILTTRSDDDARETVLAAGATDYLTKPFDPATLTDHARRFLDVR